ncbi:MAG: transglycosylase SLT domain-containing protein [Cryobacterium sp.]|nr:transglycosylase SLT domain-containing protein [Cryobacterium sp.]MBX3089189.1 transglycosylase SLT domain-containing protein [Cryobacterium sp.]MCC7127891.1 transglycosylase SLT domain-containing protein [Microbacteriaceae bacterium]
MLPGLAFAVSAAILMVSVIAPTQRSVVLAETITSSVRPGEIQVLALDGDYIIEAVRDSYRVSRKPIAPAAGTPDPGTAQAIALELVLARGWDQSQYDCLAALWQKESHWNVFAMNPYSGAYGIPQALPGDKMASAGPDWATNPRTQIIWGLGYISARYVNPCGAWQHSKDHNWY